MPTPNLITAASMVPALLASAQAANGTSTVYTVPANTAVRLTNGTLCNVSAAAVTVSLALVPSGQAADGTHKVIDSFSLPAHDSLPLRDYLADHVLGAGDFISITVSAGAAVDVVLSGLVTT